MSGELVFDPSKIPWEEVTFIGHHYRVPSNEELLASCETMKPPQSWYDEDHTGLFDHVRPDAIVDSD